MENDNVNNNQKKIIETILSSIEKTVSYDEISINDDLRSLEINSLKFINTVVALENEFDFEFDDEMLVMAKFPDIKSLVDYVEYKTSTNIQNIQDENYIDTCK